MHKRRLRRALKVGAVFVWGLLCGCALLTQAQSKLKDGGKPRVTKVAGSTTAACVNLPQTLRVCKIENTADLDDYQRHFLITRGGRQVGKIDIPVSASSSVETFNALYGDLNADGSPELIVADLGSVGNGLGVRNYTIYIFPLLQPNAAQPLPEPLEYDTQEFGAQGGFVTDAKTGETLLLVTEWRDYAHLDARRGSGLYLVGKFFRYRGNHLEYAADKPILARRYLNSFERERGATYDDARIPYLWLGNGKALQLKSDPEFAVPPVQTLNGTIERYTETLERDPNDEAGAPPHKVWTAYIRLSDGSQRMWRPGAERYEVSGEPDPQQIFPEVIGLAPQMIALPGGIGISNIIGKLEGKQVALQFYSNELAEANNESDQTVSPVLKLLFRP